MSHWLRWLVSTYLSCPVLVTVDQDDAPLAKIEEGTDTEDFFGRWIEEDGWETWVPKTPSVCWRCPGRTLPWCPEGTVHLTNKRAHKSQRRWRKRLRNRLFGGVPPELTNHPEIKRDENLEEPPTAPDAPLTQLHCTSCHCHSYIIPAVTDLTYTVTTQPSQAKRTMCVNPLPPQSVASFPDLGPVHEPRHGPAVDHDPDPGTELNNLL